MSEPRAAIGGFYAIVGAQKWHRFEAGASESVCGKWRLRDTTPFAALALDTVEAGDVCKLCKTLTKGKGK